MAVERALISVFDKTGIVDLAKRLAALRIEILSTGGTSKLLREAGVTVRDVSDFTGWPESPNESPPRWTVRPGTRQLAGARR